MEKCLQQITASPDKTKYMDTCIHMFIKHVFRRATTKSILSAVIKVGEEIIMEEATSSRAPFLGLNLRLQQDGITKDKIKVQVQTQPVEIKTTI